MIVVVSLSHREGLIMLISLIKSETTSDKVFRAFE